jgi:hypothetical protein
MRNWMPFRAVELGLDVVGKRLGGARVLELAGRRLVLGEHHAGLAHDLLGDQHQARSAFKQAGVE